MGDQELGVIRLDPTSLEYKHVQHNFMATILPVACASALIDIVLVGGQVQAGTPTSLIPVCNHVRGNVNVYLSTTMLVKCV